MKRIIITLLVLVGVGGLIALLTYHPKSTTVGSANVSPGVTSNQTATTPGATTTSYHDGTYTGTSADNAYGTVQVQAVVSGGKLTAVNLLQMPSDQGHSQEIAAQAGPILQQEAITAQSASVDTVSGATQDSESFVQSLGAALSQAKA